MPLNTEAIERASPRAVRPGPGMDTHAGSHVAGGALPGSAKQQQRSLEAMHASWERRQEHERAAAAAAAATAAATATAAAAAAPAASTAPPPLPPGWVAAWDATYARWYFCNSALGLSQWEAPQADPPPAPGGDAAVATAAAEAGAAAAAAPRPPVSGWCYQDARGAAHGPFNEAQLAAWRESLPMDLLVWFHDADAGEGGGAAEGAGADADAGGVGPLTAAAAAGEALSGGGGGDAAGAQPEAAAAALGEGEGPPAEAGEGAAAARCEPAAAAAAASPGEWYRQQLPAIELAELLGDGHLLADWRRRVDATGGLDPTQHPTGAPHAPPASAWQAWLERRGGGAAAAADAATGGGRWAATHAPHAAAAATAAAAAAPAGAAPSAGGAAPLRGSSAAEYAEAVLAGLPPDDEAVQMARVAAACNLDLSQVMAFQWQQQQQGGGGGGGGAAAPSTATPLGGGGGDEHGGGGAAGRVQYFHNPHSGRLEARAAPQGSAGLYGELGRWCDPGQLEASLRASNEARKRGAAQAPPGGWRAYMDARKEARKRARLGI